MQKALWSLVSFVLCMPAAPAAAQTQLPPASTAKVDYTRDVKPLLAQHCYSCHGREVQQAGLRLDQRQNALRGGDYGPVIVPGKSADSKLIRRLVDGDGGMQMPPAGPLSPDDIGLLRAWIDQGVEFRTDVADEAPPRPVDPRLAALISAVRTAPAARVGPLVAASPDLISATDAEGSTLLHHAAGFGRLDVLTLLLDKGAAVNAVNGRRSTPLHWAIHDHQKVRLLVARGANVNARQAEGRTPLYQAASLGNGLATLEFLIERQADPNLALANGLTPLMAAARRGDVQSIQRLLDANAHVNARDGAGETALMLAAGDGNADAVRLLLARGADATLRTKRNETALGNAGTSGREDTVRLLLDAGAGVNVRNIRGYSPLMLAASSDALPVGVVTLLLAHGADPSFTGDYDETARDLAAKRGNTAVTRLLGGMPARSSPVASPGAPRASGSIAERVERALAMTAKQSETFIRTAGCNSCHSQDLPSAAAAFARSRGLKAPPVIAQLPQSMQASPERVMDLGINNAAGTAWELFDFGMNGVPRSVTTDAAVRAILAMQTPEGHWSANESRRPPMNAGDFQAVALAIYAIKTYVPLGSDVAGSESVARAVSWLDTHTPSLTQDRAFHALGLHWGDQAAAARRSALALTVTQQSDGGWSQMPDLPSDAYATGQALVALHMAGRMAVDEPVYQKGVSFLLRTQADDGTWRVASRSIWLQPYFESGFPYGRDQFISTAGTAWAAMALAAAAEVPTTHAR